MKVRLLVPAQIELDEIFAWYEKEHKGLGQHFIREVRDTLRRIVSFPESCHFNMVIYGRHEDEIVVVAMCTNGARH